MKIEFGALLNKDVIDITGKASHTCMMMAEKEGDKEELGPVPIPNEDGNWKESVSIGGVVCMILCAIQIIAFCKPDGPKRRQNDDNGVELKAQ